nr:MAG TPA: hypothetical protein [Caudoviricetes sp.]
MLQYIVDTLTNFPRSINAVRFLILCLHSPVLLRFYPRPPQVESDLAFQLFDLI